MHMNVIMHVYVGLCIIRLG